MSSEIYVDELRAGISATNTRTNETVLLVGEVENDGYHSVWIVEGNNGLYLEYENNLENPYYWG